jgi:hypothetical protein
VIRSFRSLGVVSGGVVELLISSMKIRATSPISELARASSRIELISRSTSERGEEEDTTATGTCKSFGAEGAAIVTVSTRASPPEVLTVSAISPVMVSEADSFCPMDRKGLTSVSSAIR